MTGRRRTCQLCGGQVMVAELRSGQEIELDLSAPVYMIEGGVATTALNYSEHRIVCLGRERLDYPERIGYGALIWLFVVLTFVALSILMLVGTCQKAAP